MSDYQRLKELLLAEERAELTRQQARVAELERDRDDLPAELPRLLREAQRGDGQRKLTDVLSVPVANALGNAVRDQPQTIVDALFPIIGPAIRKAIVEALRDFSEGFNRALESSFTPKGLKWRLESWRTGVPYTQVVLKHTLSFRLDHLFLIDSDSGLVLARESAPEVADLDADAIAGMLTAIGDFVRDSVGTDANGSGAGSLASATVGEHLLWVVEGPRANLAVFLRGVPPAQLRLVLQERLEQIHALLPDTPGEPADTLPAVRDALDLDRLRTAAATDPAAPKKKSRTWPLWLIAIAAAGLVGWWLVRDWQWAQHLRDVEKVARAWPGVHVEGIDGSRRGRVVVRGLIDPIAESPRDAIAAQLPPETALAFDWRGYVSTDAAIVTRRARQLLAPPDGVRVAFADGRLVLRGVAPPAWIAAARERASWIAGVATLDAENLRSAEDPTAAQHAELDAIADYFDQTRFEFIRETEPADAALLDAMAERAQRALALAAALKIDARFTCRGYNDAPGGDTLNRQLRERRADWLCAELGKRGVPAASLSSADDASMPEAPTIAVRAATMRLERARSAGQ